MDKEKGSFIISKDWVRWIFNGLITFSVVLGGYAYNGFKEFKTETRKDMSLVKDGLAALLREEKYKSQELVEMKEFMKEPHWTAKDAEPLISEIQLIKERRKDFLIQIKENTVRSSKNALLLNQLLNK